MEFSQQESALLETLAKVISQDVKVLESAETKLKQWEIQPGYYSTILKIILNYSIDPSIRWLAACIFKNGVNKYWRKTAENAVQEQEKASLRADIMNTFGEPVNTVAVQLAALIATIARYDCPSEWPELIPNLIQIIKSDNSLLQYRGLITLNQVVKALISKRLIGDRRIFISISADIFSFMLDYWNGLYENFCLQVCCDQPLCVSALEKVLVGLKILRKLTIHGFERPHESLDVCTFLNILFVRTKDMFLFRNQKKFPQVVELCEKVINHMTAVLLTLLENHPNSFVSFIQPSLNFIHMYIFAETEEDVLYEKFIIQCLNLLKGIILCSKFKPLREKRLLYMGYSSQNEIVLEVNRMKREFFLPETIERICIKLITHYFLLTTKDLQMWEDDPENFAFDDNGESWKFCLHPCTHSLYFALLHEFPEKIYPLVLRLVRENQQMVDPLDLNGILRKDAIYTAIGLCAFEFHDEVDFDQWFTTTLIHELGVKGPNYRIIRRRVIWLIGKWTNIKPVIELRPTIYSAIIPFLNKDEDMVVRLTAAVALKSILDSLEFSPDQFMNFLGPSFSMLFTLLQDVEECSTKMQILDVFKFMIERFGENIRPFSHLLIEYLPLLWEESANHNMLRCAIISTLVQFARVENLTSFLYPVIECCTDVSNDAHVYLIQDGLELWSTVVEYSSALTPELFSLYKNMPKLLEYTVEHLDCCCNIIQAYILLNSEKFLTECGESLIALCSSILTDVNERGTEKVMQVVETIIKANPDVGVKISFPMLLYIALGITDEERSTSVISIYLTIIGRVLLYSRVVFLEVLEKAANAKSWNAESLLEQILIVWNKMMPLVTQLEKRKLLALALSSLLTLQSNVVFAQFSAIVRNIVEALNDIMDINCLSDELSSLMLAEEQSIFDEEGADELTEIEKRAKQLNQSDPAYKIELKGYLQSQFNDLRSQMGSSNFEALLQTLDVEILQQCRMYIAI